MGAEISLSNRPADNLEKSITSSFSLVPFKHQWTAVVKEGIAVTEHALWVYSETSLDAVECSEDFNGREESLLDAEQPTNRLQFPIILK